MRAKIKIKDIHGMVVNVEGTVVKTNVKYNGIVRYLTAFHYIDAGKDWDHLQPACDYCEAYNIDDKEYREIIIEFPGNNYRFRSILEYECIFVNGFLFTLDELTNQLENELSK